ncbi:threonine-phosphate decarboxylase [Caulobacter segnis]|uniref:threonine-phosphate decarboxylase n=1 Tax=Caulobacter segnis TaxID=88688 RepID=UPI001CBD7675|nr:threonine-phosphate decarboxylase [Caulobacter segnis]UAL12805.1 pyridoxal phosphate-dependent class II aminotransferase [Caulobacter segnis]
MASVPTIGAFRHGGRLREAMAAHPDAPRPWLDLSTGINPEPWSGPRAPAHALTRLPDPQALNDLEALAARAFGVADPGRVVAVSGAEAALRLLPGLIDNGSVALLAPIYGGHLEAWGPASPSLVATLDDPRIARADVLIVVNPNNPDGRRIEREVLAELAVERSDRGLWTVVDESFVEVAPELSVADLEIDRLVTLRSFGKFYGLPGARLGFTIGNKMFGRNIRALIGDWPVGADALALGLGAYADEAWRASTRATLAARAREVDAVLADVGLQTVGGCDLFRLVEVADAHDLFTRLCGLGVLTRPFADRPDRLRFGLPSRNDFRRFEEVLQAVRS